MRKPFQVRNSERHVPFGKWSLAFTPFTNTSCTVTIPSITLLSVGIICLIRPAFHEQSTGWAAHQGNYPSRALNPTPRYPIPAQSDLCTRRCFSDDPTRRLPKRVGVRQRRQGKHFPHD